MTIPLEVVAAPMDIMTDITLNTIKQLFYARKINVNAEKLQDIFKIQTHATVIISPKPRLIPLS